MFPDTERLKDAVYRPVKVSLGTTITGFYAEKVRIFVASQSQAPALLTQILITTRNRCPMGLALGTSESSQSQCQEFLTQHEAVRKRSKYCLGIRKARISVLGFSCYHIEPSEESRKDKDFSLCTDTLLTPGNKNSTRLTVNHNSN